MLDDVFRVVLPGDHHVADRGLETVRQDDAGSGDGAACAVVGGGFLVELAHQVVGRGDHQSDLAGLDVADVGVEHQVRQLVGHALADAGVAGVPGQHRRIAAAQPQAGLGLAGSGETVHLLEERRAGQIAQITQHTTGFDGGELLRIAQQPHHRTGLDCDACQVRQIPRRRHARLVDEQQITLVDAGRQTDTVAGEHIGDGAALHRNLFPEHLRGTGRRTQRDDFSVAGLPGTGDHGSGGGLAGTGRTDRHSNVLPRGEEVLDQGDLVDTEAVAGRALRPADLASDHEAGDGALIVGERLLAHELLGLEDRLCGVPHLGAIDELAAPKAAFDAFGDALRAVILLGEGRLAVVPQRQFQGVVVHRPQLVVGVETELTQLPVDLGGQREHRPGADPARERIDHVFHQRGHLGGGEHRTTIAFALHRIDQIGRIASGENRLGALTPFGPQLGQRARRILRVAGIEGGLLRLGVLHLLRRILAVPILVLTRQLFLACLDFRPAGELLDQRQRDADDLVDRLLADRRIGPASEGDTELARDQLGHTGVVLLRAGDVRLVQNRPVDRGPLVLGQHPVEHGAVGVQVRIRGTIVVVIEPGHQQTLGLDLARTAGPAAGVDHLVLDPLQRLGHRLRMGFFDRGLDLLVAEPPQQRHRLHRREHQVITGHRLPNLGVLLGDELPHLLLAEQVGLLALPAAKMLAGGRELDRLLRIRGRVFAVLRLVGTAQFLDVVDVLLAVLVPRKRPAQRRLPRPIQPVLARGIRSGPGIECGRCASGTEHRPHRRFGDFGADLDTDLLGQLAAPDTGWSALGDVVIDRIGLAGLSGVALGNVLGEIDIAVPSVELVDGHHGS